MSWGQSDRDRKLQRELEDERYARERAEDLLQREQEARQREAEEAKEAYRARREMYAQEWENKQRTASTWPEALRKQIDLYGIEAHQDSEHDDTGAWFIEQVEACKRALELWREEEQKIAPALADLQRQIDALRDGIRLAVADRLEAEMPDNDHVARTLRETPEDEDELSAWLDW